MPLFLLLGAGAVRRLVGGGAAAREADGDAVAAVDAGGRGAAAALEDDEGSTAAAAAGGAGVSVAGPADGPADGEGACWRDARTPITSSAPTAAAAVPTSVRRRDRDGGGVRAGVATETEDGC
ncbi:MAG TPA: hypothetical protein VIJ22_10265, partial [Polyangiaceae bacterium]